MNKFFLGTLLLSLSLSTASCQISNEDYFNSLIKNYYDLTVPLVCELQKIHDSNMKGDCSSSTETLMINIGKKHLGTDTTLCHLDIGYSTKTPQNYDCTVAVGYPIVGIFPHFADSKMISNNVCEFICGEHLFRLKAVLHRYYTPTSINDKLYSGFLRFQLSRFNSDNDSTMLYFDLMRLIPQEYGIDNKHYALKCPNITNQINNIRAQ
jgi:hypothetical protein